MFRGEPNSSVSIQGPAYAETSAVVLIPNGPSVDSDRFWQLVKRMLVHLPGNNSEPMLTHVMDRSGEKLLLASKIVPL